MTLRTVALGVTLIALAAALLGGMAWGENWPFVLFLAGLSVLLAVERRHYGRAVAGRPGPGWAETDEQFVDDATGKLVRVWYNAQTGERRYVEVDHG